jgi:hypothetical protein
MPRAETGQAATGMLFAPVQSVRDVTGPYPTRHPPTPPFFIFNLTRNFADIFNKPGINTFQRPLYRDI